MVSICCSPPDSTPAGLSCRSARLGNSAYTSSNFQSPDDAGALQSEFEVLFHRQPRKNLAVLRHVADAEMGDLVGTQARDRAALEARSAPTGGTSPMMALQVVERPTPLRPSRLTISPCVDREVDALQDMALAIEGVEIADLEHHAATVPR